MRSGISAVALLPIGFIALNILRDASGGYAVKIREFFRRVNMSQLNSIAAKDRVETIHQSGLEANA
jgi:hypothetical protein